MILENTRLVTKDNGPGPAGKADECFYCHRTIGDYHRFECALLRRVALIKMEITIPIDYPVSFTKDDIEFHLNESSSCADNIIDKLKEYSEKLDCLCGSDIKFTFVGEAETSDEANKAR